MSKDTSIVKRLILDFLDFLRFKVENDKLTMEDMKSCERALMENLPLSGTIGEFAEYFGKSKDAVNGIIKRNVPEKPRRNIVLYPFLSFLKRVPERWRKSG